MNTISLRSPADVVAVLPYQLGYHPHDSIVVVALRDRAVGLIERVDLPCPADAEEAARVLMAPLLREEPDAVLLVAYESRAGASRPALDSVRRHLLRAEVAVLDRMVVRGDRWYAIDCVQGCCPGEGSPLQSPADTPAVAEFVGLGVWPLTGRGALADLVAADPERTPAVAAALADRAAWEDTVTVMDRPASSARPASVARPASLDTAARAVSRLTGAGADASRAVAARRFEALAGWAAVCDLGDDLDGDDLGGGRHRDDLGGDQDGDDLDGDLRGDLGGDVGGRGAGDVAAVDALGADQVALLVESLRDVELRDALVAWLCPGSLPLDCLSPDLQDALRTCLPTPSWFAPPGAVRADATGRTSVAAGRRLVVRLQRLVGAVPDADAAAPLTVLANLAWWLGDGALARTCLVRALTASPGYRLALLLERMLDLGVRPGGSACAEGNDGARAG